jgi:hypothetical protein
MTGILANALHDDDFLTALESFIAVYKEERQRKDLPAIPLSLFANRQLGNLEALAKYLRENEQLSYSQIARLLNRNDRTIWTAYHHAVHKHKRPFVASKNDPRIPCTIFSDRNRGPLEVLVLYLRNELNLSFKQIASMLNRNYATVWLTYKNGMKKNER